MGKAENEAQKTPLTGLFTSHLEIQSQMCVLVSAVQLVVRLFHS